MTLFLQYNVNNHIWDGACHLWLPSVLSVSESVLSKDLLNSEPFCVILATPLLVSELERKSGQRLQR